MKVKIVFVAMALSVSAAAHASTQEFNCGGIGLQIKDPIIGKAGAKFGGHELSLCSKDGILQMFRDLCNEKASKL